MRSASWSCANEKLGRESMKSYGEEKKTKMIPALFSLIVFAALLLAALSGMAIAAPAWQEEWERVLRAAKSEGKLAMIGPLGADRRDALTEAFQSRRQKTGAGVHWSLSIRAANF